MTSGQLGSDAHSFIEPSYTATFSCPNLFNNNAFHVAAIPPPQYVITFLFGSSVPNFSNVARNTSSLYSKRVSGSEWLPKNAFLLPEICPGRGYVVVSPRKSASVGRLSSFHLRKPPSNTATLSNPSYFNCQRRRADQSDARASTFTMWTTVGNDNVALFHNAKWLNRF